MADAGVRGVRIRRRVSPDRHATGAVHVVVQSWRSLGEERRLAARLPDRHAWHRREGARGVDLQEPALLRSCAADHRLRFRVAVTNADSEKIRTGAVSYTHLRAHETDSYL